MRVQLSPSFFYTDILHAKKTKEKLSRDRVALFYEHASKFQPFLKNNIFFAVIMLLAIIRSFPGLN